MHQICSTLNHARRARRADLPAVRRARRLHPHCVPGPRPARAAKAKALERCADAGLAVLLVAAVDAETNLDQVGDIVRHGIAHPAVRGVVFQPVTRAGRMPTFDPRHAAHQPRRHQGPRRAMSRLVPGLGLLPGAVLLSDLPLGHLPARRRRRRHPDHRGCCRWRTTSTTSPTGRCPTRRCARAGGSVERIGDPRLADHDRPAAPLP